MHFDLTPLYRSSIGFDRLASLLETASNQDAGTTSYPPYNIELLGENEYRITMAVAGFSEEDINIEIKEQSLTITGEKVEETSSEYLHQGIAARNFERQFKLADHVEVIGASLANGLLHVDLKRELPETMKPRSIEITVGKTEKPKAIGKKAA